jgi:chemosensory pili system protein ChpA (sensor histidine kinase/response regulator)
VQEAVLRECIVNMARIKEAVTQALSAPAEAQGLDQVPQLVRGITAGLLMLGKQRAVEVMEARRSRAGHDRAAGRGGAGRRTARADSPTPSSPSSTTWRRCRPVASDQWQMLEAAEARLGEIEPVERRASIPWREVRTPAEPEHAPCPTARRCRQQPSLRSTVAVGTVPAPPAPGIPPGSPSPQVALLATAAADPEFLQLFVEEARENVTRLDELFPQVGSRTRSDAEALRDLRRAFHTLKGSGRMVGAQRIGEFSWSVESLLNRVISQTLPRSPDIVFVVRDAVVCDAAADRRNRRRR